MKTDTVYTLMKILFVATIFPRPDQPMRGIYNHRLCEALAANHEVRVVSPFPWVDRIKHSFRRKSNESDRVAFTIERPTYFYPPGVFRRHYGSFMWASVRKRLHHVMATFRPTHVIGYWAHPDGEVAVRAARKFGIPAAVMVGGSDVLLLTRQSARRRRIVRVLRSADAVVAVSRDIREKVMALGVDPTQVHVVSRGSDTQMFQPGDRSEARRRLRIDPSSPVLLFVGNLNPLKGVDVLLDAMTLLRNGKTNPTLFILGDGPARSRLQAQAAALGLTDRVRFVGQVLQHDLADWYRAADMTVLPSRSEGVPNVLRESIACGTPFVATRIGGIPEVADPDCDSLVPVNDTQALAAAIVGVLSNPKPRRSNHVDSRIISWSDSTERIVEILDLLTPGSSAPFRWD